MGSEPKFASLVDLLQLRAQTKPDALAYEMLRGDGEVSRSVTYAELDRQAMGIADALLKACNPGDRALLLYNSGVEFIAAFFGCLYAGVIGVPLYPPRLNNHFSRVVSVARDCAPALILTSSANRRQTETLLEEIPVDARPRLFESESIPPAGEGNVWHCERTDLAFLQYTSGSTGTPKGVMVSHANLLHNLGHMYRGFGYNDDSHMVSWLPVHHDLGLIFGVLLPLYGAFPATLLQPAAFVQRPYRWLKAISDRRATTTGAPNFAFELCIDSITQDDKKDLDLSSLKQVLNAAEPVRANTLQRFSQYFVTCGFRTDVMNPCYGMAEATLLISMHQNNQPMVIDNVDAAALEQGQVRTVPQDSHTVVGCGDGFDDQQVVIVDPNTKRVCEPHQIGELWVSGPSVCMGYWNNSEVTNETFGAQINGGSGQRFLRTGDLAYIRDGKVFITGRQKDLIIIRGRNHYPQDIEYTVQDCWQGFHSERGAAFSTEVGQEEKLVVVQEVGRVYRNKIDSEKIGLLTANAIAEEHELQLHALVVVRPTSIPLTSSGKIQRQLTKRMWQAGELEVLATWQITNSAELEPNAPPRLGADAFGPGFQAWLRFELATQFKVPAESIPLNEPFAYLGLDSLIATTVANKLGELVGSKVEPNCLYDYPTIKSLSAWLTLQFGVAEQSSNSSVTNTNGQHVMDLDRIEGMTDEEASVLLQKI